MSIRGRPAATSEPKASTMIVSVTGQLNSSLLSIASRLASLKSLHSPDEPVRATVTPSPDSSRSGSLRSSAARTISFMFVVAAPAWTTPVRPSSETESPGVGGTIVDRRASSRSSATASWTTCAPRPVVRPPSAWTTTCRAALDRPPNCCWTRSRACTDSEPDASQPAPARAPSTRGAKAPSPTTTTAQTTSRRRKCPAVHRPSLPSGPCEGEGWSVSPGPGVRVLRAMRSPEFVSVTPAGVCGWREGP